MDYHFCISRPAFFKNSPKNKLVLLAKIKPLNIDTKELFGASSFIITSKNALLALPKNCPKKPIFTLSLASAKAAKDRGFTHIYTAKSPYGSALFKELACSKRPLYFAAKYGLLKGQILSAPLFLRGKNIITSKQDRARVKNLKELVTYEVEAISWPNALSLKPNDRAYFYSPNCVRMALAAGFELKQAQKIAIGKSTQKAIREAFSS